MILAAAALAGIAAIALTQSRANATELRRSGRKATIAVLGFAAVFTVLFGLGRVLTRFEADQGPDLRGRPEPAPPSRPRLKRFPSDRAGLLRPGLCGCGKDRGHVRGYANRAHNDLAELLLETGLLGAILLLAFLAWFARRAWAVWFAQQQRAIRFRPCWKRPQPSRSPCFSRIRSWIIL